MTKKLSQLRSGDEFISYALKNGAEIRNGKGSHRVVKTDKGAIVIPVHAKELGKGLRLKLIKYFIAFGLGIYFISIIL